MDVSGVPLGLRGFIEAPGKSRATGPNITQKHPVGFQGLWQCGGKMLLAASFADLRGCLIVLHVCIRGRLAMNKIPPPGNYHIMSKPCPYRHCCSKILVQGCPKSVFLPGLYSFAS